MHELLVVDLHPAVAVGVDPEHRGTSPRSVRKRAYKNIPLERFREGLHNDTRPNEAVKRDARRGAVPVRRTRSYFGN